MAVSHPFKATNVFLSNSGGASLSGELMLNGSTPINVHVSIEPPSSSGQRAVLSGPLSNARITIELAAHENTAASLRAATSVSIAFETSSPIPSPPFAGQAFSSFNFSIVRKLDA